MLLHLVTNVQQNDRSVDKYAFQNEKGLLSEL